MNQEKQITPPSVVWAQRSSLLYVTICLEDCKDPTIKIEPEKIYFKGTGGTEHKEHEVTINLHKAIIPEKVVQSAKGGRVIELVLTKKEDGPYWPRLTKESNKYHWLKSDFNKWKDEDDSENESDENNPRDLESVMKNMGYVGGPPGEEKPNFDEIDVPEEVDSDDDEMPELE